MLFAYLDEADRADALAQPSLKRTPLSVVDKRRLIAQGAEIRAKGWDLAVDDFVVGLAGLGVPIVSRSNRLVGAISVSTLTTAFGDPGAPRHLDTLKAVATAIGQRIND